jgi:hypothetical protein
MVVGIEMVDHMVKAAKEKTTAMDEVMEVVDPLITPLTPLLLLANHPRMMPCLHESSICTNTHMSIIMALTQTQRTMQSSMLVISVMISVRIITLVSPATLHDVLHLTITPLFHSSFILFPCTRSTTKYLHG